MYLLTQSTCVPVLIRSKKCNRYRYLLLKTYSTCFGCLSIPSSGVHQTVTAASGTGHITYQDNDLLPTWPNQATLAEGRCSDTLYDLYHKLQLQSDELLMMGSIDTRNMQSKFAVINTCICCILLDLINSLALEMDI